MKIKAIIPFPLLIILLIGFNGCKDESDAAALENSLCSPSSEHYFSGVVGEMLDCWNEGEYNYQVYHGWGSKINTNGDTTHYWQPGLDQYPVPDINKTIHVYIEVPYAITGCSSDQFHSTFQEGFYNFNPINLPGDQGIEVHYSVNGTHYSSAYGAQDDSYLECTEVSETEIYGLNEALNISWKFRCKLYDQGGTFYKELKIGKLRTSILRAK